MKFGMQKYHKQGYHETYYHVKSYKHGDGAKRKVYVWHLSGTSSM
jgi:hypothetical protein